MSNLDKTAIPINDQKHNDDLENNNQNVNVESYPIPQNRVILLGIDNSDHIKSVIYSRAKVVKFLTIIDGFFLTLNFIISIVNRNIPTYPNLRFIPFLFIFTFIIFSIVYGIYKHF